MNYTQLTSSERKKMRSEEIRKKFAQLDAVRENGVKKYTSEWIYASIAKSYWLSVSTIEHIVFMRNGYD